jgi:hypothetical protein
MKTFWMMVFLTVMAVPAVAQTAATIHLFPQIADGKMGSDVIYKSYIYLTNLNSTMALCSVDLHGMESSRLDSSSMVPVLNGYSFVIQTSGQGPLATGYAGVSCMQPVYASLVYSQSRSDGTVDGMATVFSAPPVKYAQIPVLLGENFRYGYSIANTNDSAMDVDVYLAVVGINLSSKTLTIPARSKLGGYLDELFGIQGSGIFSLKFVSASEKKFSVTALVFSGSTFATLLPAY